MLQCNRRLRLNSSVKVIVKDMVIWTYFSSNCHWQLSLANFVAAVYSVRSGHVCPTVSVRACIGCPCPLSCF